MEKHINILQGSYNKISDRRGQTRDCTDPWTFMQILSNKSIRPCCFSGVKIGSVKEEEGGITGALNSSAAITLRKELLTGKLDEYCSICSNKPMTDVAVFRRKIYLLIKLDRLWPYYEKVSSFCSHIMQL
jgi:hypothetical protein